MSSRLLDHEWLPVAERLPVGGSVRITHSCGRTPALVVYSSPGKLSAHCHRCKQWGSHTLTHRRPVAPLQEPRLNNRLPTQYLPLQETPEYVQREVWTFLLSKGMFPSMLAADTLFYSREHHRIAIRIGTGQYLARTLGDSVPKWVHYSDSAVHQAYATFGAETPQVVITEDLLSAAKVHYATGLQTYALLGTTVPAALTVNFLQRFQEGGFECVHVMLDADPAGYAGAVRACNNFGFNGIPYKVVQLPEGVDPKDLQIQKLKELVL